MPNRDAKNCWEYWECKPEIREKCPAFNSDKQCWYVANQYCGRITDKRGIEKCFNCEWYRLKHSRESRVL